MANNRQSPIASAEGEPLPAPQHTLVAASLSVDFRWLGDRFGHAISLVKDDDIKIVWQSLDTGEYLPVFQELHEQATDDGKSILFLSGAGGGAHWSMSVCVNGHSIDFDVAARVSSEPIVRAIEYTLVGDQKSAIALCPQPQDPQSAVIVELSSSGAKLSPEPQNIEVIPATLRWRYSATVE